LYAQDRWAVLLIFQALDAAGKDSVIKHVMSGLNPQGCEVHAFKAPSTDELDHDFLWRTSRALTRLVVASAVVEALESLRPAFPRLDAQKRRDLRVARAALLSEGRKRRRS
jgi:hypothetical protein